MNNISGNYKTEAKEIQIVKFYLEKNNIQYQNIAKDKNRDDSDVIVKLNDERIISFEVKNESYERFRKYGDLGIDYISVCVFKNNDEASLWKGTPKRPSMQQKFLNSLDINSQYFKWGKVVYSKADYWLFYVSTDNNISSPSIVYCEVFDGKKMVSEEFLDYLKHNCPFTVNNKPSNQLSYYDNHHSATFFINHSNPIIKNYLVKKI